MCDRSPVETRAAFSDRDVDLGEDFSGMSAYPRRTSEGPQRQSCVFRERAVRLPLVRAERAFLTARAA